MQALLIKLGKVENCILADSVERARQFYPEHFCVERTEALAHVGPGWTLEGETWVAPVPPPAPPEDRRVTKLAFRKRFAQSERAAMELAAIHNAALPINHPANVLAADLRASMADQRDALFIDLEDPDTRNGVIALEDAGLLAEGRADAILNAPVQERERYTGGV